ncbi:MAG TPA: response regulator transcription factor [Ruminiclostridium sp.]|nr:response regulator transcription factor [Ruminiclostridium sp.]
MNKIRLVIADDSPFVREGLKIIFDLDDDYDVVGCAANGREAIILADSCKADIFLMDIKMPEVSGIEATKYIVSKKLAKVLILTTFDDDDLIVQALKMGAKGYLIKNHPPEKIKQMVKLVYEGGSILEEAVLDKVTTGLNSNKPTAEFDAQPFTDRELDIIKLISRGYSNKDIADELYISEGTVKNYISAILSKTGLSHRTQIAIYYLTGNSGKKG